MKLFAMDSEFDLFSEGLAAPPPVVFSFATEERSWLALPEEAAAILREYLSDPDVHLIGQSIATDICEACVVDPTLIDLFFKAGDEDRLHDVGMREALEDIAGGILFQDFETGKDFAKRDPETGEMSGRYSMAYMMRRHFNVNIAEEKHGERSWRKRYALLRGLPLEKWPVEAREYALNDASDPIKIFKSQIERGYRNLHDECRQVRGAFGLQLMHVWGLRTDAQYLADIEARVDAEWTRAREEFHKVGIFRLEKGKYVKTTKVLQAMVTKAYDGNPPYTPPSDKYPDGQISTDRDTLVESGDPILAALGQSGKNDKRKSLYVPTLKKGRFVPVLPNFNPIVDTGRVSSDFQQLPQKGGMREAILARGYLKELARTSPVLRQMLEAEGVDVENLPDTVLCSCDFEGLELRTMAQRAIWDPDVGYSLMAEYLNSGKDAHCYVAGITMGIPYEEAYALHKSGDPKFKAFRDGAKIFNFGKGGGMGFKTLAYQARAKDNVRFCLLFGRATKCGEEKIDIRVQGKQKRLCAVCAEVAEELDAKWYEAWPEQQALKEKAQALCPFDKVNRVQTTVDCLIPWSNRVRGNCSYTQWLNSPFQGMGGDGVKLATWRIQKEQYTDRKSPLFRSRLPLNIHDELAGEFPEDRTTEAGFRMAKIMTDSMNEVTPDVRNSVEPAFGRRLFKGMKLVKDKDGNALPWWPGPKDWTWAPDQARMSEDMSRVVRS